MLNQTNLSERKLPDPLRLRGGGLLNIEVARVYFMGGGGLIKIGVTTDVDARLRSLSNSSPVPIRYLGSYLGTREAEREMHDKFKHLRRHGEWFDDTPELRAEIEDRCGDMWLVDDTIPFGHVV